MKLIRCDRCNYEINPDKSIIVKIGTDYAYRQTNFGVEEYDLCEDCKNLLIKFLKEYSIGKYEKTKM